MYKPDFDKRQLLVSKSGMVVLSDGTGLHVCDGHVGQSFSGIVLFDPHLPDGLFEPGKFCKTLVPERFEAEVPSIIFSKYLNQ